MDKEEAAMMRNLLIAAVGGCVVVAARHLSGAEFGPFYVGAAVGSLTSLAMFLAADRHA